MGIKLLSIVTVNYNSGDDFKKTLNSIKSFLGFYSSVQYIVIDGCSDDSSGELIEGLVDDSQVDVLIEPDVGIYDAMNKGISLAKGDYLLFLNAGDVFANPLESANELIHDNSNPDIYYADLLLSNGQLSKQSLNLGFLMHNCTNHQSMLIKTELLKNRMYDLRYRICADYDWILNQNTSLNYKKLEHPLTCYDTNGLSSEMSTSLRRSLWFERYLIIKRSSIPTQYKLLGVAVALSALIVKSAFPKAFSRVH